MVPKRKENRIILVCPRCGNTIEPKGSIKGYVHETRVLHKPSEKTVVIEEELKIGVKVKAVCPECGYNEAYYWEVQTRSADEPTTAFFRCVRCGYTWREYG